jgi:lipopolysaccharide biosynthesis glycosyltransferase
MNFTTVVDIGQWNYVFPNILVLESYKQKYTYGIFTGCGTTYNLLKAKIKALDFKYGKVYTKLIPGFFNYFNLTTMTPNHDWITGTTMDRFVVPDFCEYTRYVHLDADTLIVSKDIFKLNEIEVSDRGLAAVPSPTTLVEHVLAFSAADFLLDQVKENKYTFNAGIMVFDTDKLKKHKFKDFIRDMYARGENTAYINDELILNLYDPGFKILDDKYNVKVYLYEELKLSPEEVTVVHFSGKTYKPWSRTYFSNISKLRKYYGLWEYHYYSIFD